MLVSSTARHLFVPAIYNAELLKLRLDSFIITDGTPDILIGLSK
jgi:hypothetical protein